jgi:hypothetical protein
MNQYKRIFVVGHPGAGKGPRLKIVAFAAVSKPLFGNFTNIIIKLYYFFTVNKNLIFTLNSD